MRPANLGVIMSDEHHPRAMGIAGHAFVVTPNLDRLARRGTRFDAATCNSPICVPSRASFATGRYVHELGTWDNAIAYDGSVPGWGHALQRTRHRVDSIGKLHYRNTEDAVGFDHQYHPMHIYGGHGMVWGALRDGSTDFSDRAHVMLDPIGPGTSKYNIYDDRIASEAERWIERAAGERSERPWVLFVGFVAPHFPLTVPEEILKLYPTASMPLPRLHPNRGHPRHPWLEASHRIHPVDDGLDEQRRRLATACYYGLCTWVDRQVGRVIDALDRSGLSDTTRIIYTSDHGDNIGARGIWGKSTHYEDAVGVPMIVAGPDVTRGHVCRTPVSLVDLAPTILDAVGEDPYGWAENLPGRSLLEIGEQPDDATRTVFSEYHAFASPCGLHAEKRAFQVQLLRRLPRGAVPSRRRSGLGAHPSRHRPACSRPGAVRAKATRPVGPRGHRRPSQSRPSGSDRPLRRADSGSQRRRAGGHPGADLNRHVSR